MSRTDLSFYKLQREPFLLTPDPQFLHLADPHRQALASLVRGVLARKGFMTLTGEAGTGKTTLLHAALHLFTRIYARGEHGYPRQTIPSALLVNPRMTPDELLESVLEEFDVVCVSRSKPMRLQALHDHLMRVGMLGGTAVLIVDEAHLMPVELLEEIRLLTNIESYGGKLLQVILCGQPELSAVLLKPEMRALRQRVAVVARLRPLLLEETRAYVEQRLEAAGLAGPNPFEDATIERVHRVAKGTPRLINVLCDAALGLGCRRNEARIGCGLVEEAAERLALLEADRDLGQVQPQTATEDCGEAAGGVDVAEEMAADAPPPAAVPEAPPVPLENLHEAAAGGCA